LTLLWLNRHKLNHLLIIIKDENILALNGRFDQFN
jgi:hypothetical protein